MSEPIYVPTIEDVFYRLNPDEVNVAVADMVTSLREFRTQITASIKPYGKNTRVVTHPVSGDSIARHELIKEMAEAGLTNMQISNILNIVSAVVTNATKGMTLLKANKVNASVKDMTDNLEVLKKYST